MEVYVFANIYVEMIREMIAAECCVTTMFSDLDFYWLSEKINDPNPKWSWRNRKDISSEILDQEKI